MRHEYMIKQMIAVFQKSLAFMDDTICQRQSFDKCSHKSILPKVVVGQTKRGEMLIEAKPQTLREIHQDIWKINTNF